MLIAVDKKGLGSYRTVPQDHQELYNDEEIGKRTPNNQKKRIMNYDPGEDYSELSPLPRGFKIFLLVFAATLLASAIFFV